jgi:hypothetical protein
MSIWRSSYNFFISALKATTLNASVTMSIKLTFESMLISNTLFYILARVSKSSIKLRII